MPFKYNPFTGTFDISDTTTRTSITGFTEDYVPYGAADGSLDESASLQFNGSQFLVGDTVLTQDSYIKVINKNGPIIYYKSGIKFDNNNTGKDDLWIYVDNTAKAYFKGKYGAATRNFMTFDDANNRIGFNQDAPAVSWHNSTGLSRFDGGNVEINVDSNKLLFGAGLDASIYYDGTDMIFNPLEVGNGKAKFIFDDCNVFMDEGNSGDTAFPICALDNTNSSAREGAAFRFLKNGANKWGFGSDFDNDGTHNFWIYDYNTSQERLVVDSDITSFTFPDCRIYFDQGGTGTSAVPLMIIDNQHAGAKMGAVLRLAKNDTEKWGWGMDYLNDGTHNMWFYDYVSAAPVLLIDSNNDVQIPTDNKKMMWGAGYDCSISYDGTDMIINPKEVGTGDVEVQGTLRLNADNDKIMFGAGEDTSIYFDSADLIIASENVTANDEVVIQDFDALAIASADTYWTGDGSGIPYGSMYTNTTIAVTLTDQNTWYELDGATAWTVGEQNLCTFTDPEISVTKAGRYEIIWTLSTDFSASPGAAQQIEYGIMINGSIQNPGQAHRTLANSTDTGHCSGVAILDLAADDDVSLAARNVSSAGKTLHVEHGNLSVKMIGGT